MRVLWAVALVTVGLAGCGDKDDSPTGMFADADHRWAGQSLEPFEESTTVILPAGVHTLHLAAQSKQGFAITFTGPGGEGHGFTHSWNVDIGRLDYTVTSELDGVWNLAYGCDAACEYAIAVDLGDHVPTNAAPSVQDVATAHVAGTLDDASQRHEFEVPDGNVTMRFHLQSSEAMRWAIRDGAGNLVTNWNFDKVHARDWRYGPSNPDTVPGTWRADVVCDGMCSYNFGVIVA